MKRPGLPSGETGRQLLSFSFVGVIGFVVDAVALYLVMGLFGAGLYLGRLFSYLCAATATWALNRRFTFHDRRSAHRVSEWLRFLGANALGGLANYGTYSLLVWRHPEVAAHPVIGVAAGSLAGLAVNFVLSRRLVFRGSRPSA